MERTSSPGIIIYYKDYLSFDEHVMYRYPLLVWTIILFDFTCFDMFILFHPNLSSYYLILSRYDYEECATEGANAMITHLNQILAGTIFFIIIIPSSPSSVLP